LTGLPKKELLRPDEVAEYLRLDIRTIYDWIACGDLKAVRVGGKCLRIPREAVEKVVIPVPI
jgi:excisionase family DNA binding protein